MTNDALVEVATTDSWALNVKSPRDTRVIAAMRHVDRADYLPEAIMQQAYVNHALPIGHDATCSQPSLVGLMADLLELHDDSVVLEIGAGCGYAAAVIANIVKKGKVITTEIVPELVEMAKDNTAHLSNVEVIHGDGSEGLSKFAPYNAIVFTAAVNVNSFNPNILLNQLSDDGILLFPEKTSQSLFIYTKKGEIVNINQVHGVAFVDLQGTNT